MSRPSAPQLEFWTLPTKKAEKETYFIREILPSLNGHRPHPNWIHHERALQKRRYGWARFFFAPKQRQNDIDQAVNVFQENSHKTTSKLSKIANGLFYSLLRASFQRQVRNVLGSDEFPDLVPSHTKATTLFRSSVRSVKYWLKFYEGLLETTLCNQKYRLFCRRVAEFCFHTTGVRGHGEPDQDITWLRKLGRLQASLENKYRVIRDLESQTNYQQIAIQDLDDHIRALQGDLARANSENGRLECRRIQFQEEIGTAGQQMVDLEAQKSDLEHTIRDLNIRIQEAEDEIQSQTHRAKEEQEDSKLALQGLKVQLQDLQNRLREERDMAADLCKLRDELQGGLNQANGAINTLRNSLDYEHEMAQQLEEQRDRFQKTLEETRHRLAAHDRTRTVLCFRGIFEKLPHDKNNAHLSNKQAWDMFIRCALDKAKADDNHLLSALLGCFNSVEDAVSKLGRQMYGSLSREIHDYLDTSRNIPGIQFAWDDSSWDNPTWDDVEKKLFQSLVPVSFHDDGKINWEAERQRFGVIWSRQDQKFI